MLSEFVWTMSDIVNTCVFVLCGTAFIVMVVWSYIYGLLMKRRNRRGSVISKKNQPNPIEGWRDDAALQAFLAERCSTRNPDAKAWDFDD